MSLEKNLLYNWLNAVLIFIAFSINFIEISIADLTRIEKDLTGKEWELREWIDGSRPYPKNIIEREKWYRQKWGENWYGPSQNVHIFSPGAWKWKTIDTLPPDMAARIKGNPNLIWKAVLWGSRYNIMNFLWAPGGEEATDFYAMSDNVFYHYDLITKKRTFIGKPEEGGLKDGSMEDARLYPEDHAVIDPVTGRLYFTQKYLNEMEKNKKNTYSKSPFLRYIEKLYPYKCMSVPNNKTYYFPAVLEWRELYKKVKGPDNCTLEPVMNGGTRADPVFEVKTNQNIKEKKDYLVFNLPGTGIGKRLLLTPDGKGLWLSQKVSGSDTSPFDTKTLYDTTALFDINSGKVIQLLNPHGYLPLNNWDTAHKKYWDTAGPGTHGGNNVGYDGQIYTAQHPGCCGPWGRGQGRMFSIDHANGKITMLYNSMSEDDTEWIMWKYRSAKLIDGPADAKNLSFTSTLYQIQCPRTGAILNGGWDNSGIRRYHDGFVTTLVSGGEFAYYSPRPDWVKSESPSWAHRNSNPAVAPDGSLYIADVREPRVIRVYRSDWPREQPINGYAEKFMPKNKVEELMLEYAQKYIEAYEDQLKALKDK